VEDLDFVEDFDPVEDFDLVEDHGGSNEEHEGLVHWCGN
jgi:hypothetical protein